MSVALVPAVRADEGRINGLLRLYYDDMIEILGGHAGKDGRFSPPPLAPYWEDSWRYPFLIQAHERLVGFALIHRRSRLTGDPDTWDVAEFFVMRQCRRRRVGTEAALQVFEQFRGTWEVRQLHANVAATRFWRSVIGQHTRGAYTETIHDDVRWRGPVQRFDTSPHSS